MELGIERLLLWFFVETGSGEFFEAHAGALSLMILTTALAMCFFGVRIYRGAWSALVFLSVTLSLTLFLRGKADWGTIVTAFTVLGMILSVLAFHWKRLAAFILSGILAGSVVMSLSGSYLAGVLTGIGVFLVALLQPFKVLAASTALWGAMTAAVTGVHLLDFSWNASVATWMIAIALSALGFILQLLIFRSDAALQGPGAITTRFIRKNKQP